MFELATTARPVGIVVKATRRVAVALTLSIGVGLLMMHGWGGSLSSLFLRTIILGLSATAAFAFFEVWPRSLPRWFQRWALQVVAVGVVMPVTTLLIYMLSTPRGAPPFWENSARMDGWTHLTFAGLLSQTRPPLVQSIDLAVQVAPVTFQQGAQHQLVYELHLTNFQPVDVTLRSVRINDGAATIAEYRDAELQRRMTRPGLARSHATPHIIGPGMRALVNVWISMPNGRFAPAAISHTVELTVQRQSGPVDATVEGGAAAVSSTAAVTIGPPLRGGHWVAIYDPLLKGGHRTAIYTVDGRARIPGRFAIDFIALPPAGALERDPAARPPTANGFGADVLAVADGTVVAAVDDTPDQLPQPVAQEIASGNHVVIDIGGGRFAVYEHLQRGSVAVKSGQRVPRGHVIARLGSSGSTSIGPHLHFHIADANSVLGAEGLPFVFHQFTAVGGFASIAALVNGEQWLPAQPAQSLKAARPQPNSVIVFP